MSSIEKLLETVAQLREPETGCPWDIEQTHQSIADCLIEEASEVLQTIDRLDFDHMEEELGDLLLQVVMHAQMAKEAGHFDFEAVAEEINAKLVRRHPHVFGGAEQKDTEGVLNQWEAIKAQERKRGPQHEGKYFKDMPNVLPALLFARSVYKQARKHQLDLGAFVDTAAVTEAGAGLDEANAGQQLFTLVAACREQGIDPESALRRYAQQLVDTLEVEGA